MVLSAQQQKKSGPFSDLDPRHPNFSQDSAWMARLVLAAKHTPVWLHQLSERYQRPIDRLDKIPDEALAELAGFGFSGLWLVGIWMRSPASRTIKHLLGNENAEASAYSVFRYELSDRYGGEAALQDLRRRAAKFGIRLAADMVPNHTGLDSPWMVEHPDYYLSTDNPPTSNYTFTGPNLSKDPRIELYLEDHYLDQSDAAVVFKRVDVQSGEVRFIYHGNDGEDSPWNDTAQLDFLNPDMRAALTNEIISLARRFPILRFDAAMTLVNRHIRRLWYPQPGAADHVYSRQPHGLSRGQLSSALPQEFWRQVAEAVQEAVPDTLLLAEVFWMLEAYFAHHLGLNRVYNSAFMHSLREEDNAAFQQMLREILEFDPRLLSRYVNYMSTPDEDSARYQFGDDDKFFGVSTLLATLPGMPMFAHGQVEGLSEKYFMDARAPQLEERADPDLVARHQRQIAPLLAHRQLFASAEHFRMHQFRAHNGRVLSDVYAFTNAWEDERALVLFNNSPQTRRGRVVATGERKLPSLLGLGEGTDWRAQQLLNDRDSSIELTDLVASRFSFELNPYESRVIWRFEPNP